MRRGLLVGLLAAALGLLLLVLAPDAPPGAYRLAGRIGGGTVPASEAHVLVPVVVATYENGRNGTDVLVVAYCSHTPCGPGVRVRDATSAAMDLGPWILVPVSDDPVGIERLSSNIRAVGPGGEATIDTAFSATYDARPVWPLASLRAAAVAVAGSGLLLAAAVRPWERWLVPAPAIAAAGAWAYATTNPSWAVLLVGMLLFLSMAVTLLVALAVLAAKKPAYVPAALLVVQAAFLVALYATLPFYPSSGAGD